MVLKIYCYPFILVGLVPKEVALIPIRPLFCTRSARQEWLSGSGCLPPLHQVVSRPERDGGQLPPVQLTCGYWSVHLLQVVHAKGTTIPSHHVQCLPGSPLQLWLGAPLGSDQVPPATIAPGSHNLCCLNVALFPHHRQGVPRVSRQPWRNRF